MLAKLKVECGYQFTQKLEGMFNDMKISVETMQIYRQYLQNISVSQGSFKLEGRLSPFLQPPELEISVTVMTSTFWPMSHTVSTCVLPESLSRSCKSFEHYYLSRHSGRRLTWQPSLGNADVRVKFKARKHDLNVSTFALIILLLFEDVEDDSFLTYGVCSIATFAGDLRRRLFRSTGNQVHDIDTRARTATPSTIARLCQVQNLEEAPAGPRCQSRRLLLLQQWFHLPDAKNQDWHRVC